MRIAFANVMPQPISPSCGKETTSERIRRYGNELLHRVLARGTPFNHPHHMTLRSFSLGEVAEILDVSGSSLRQLSIDGLGPTPELGTAGRRSYTLRQINELRAYLASARPKEALKFCPRRREGEKLQIISVASGRGRTPTALYLAQGLALQGFRILAIDLDPESWLSEMFGYSSNALGLGRNASMYAVIRDDDCRTSIRSVIRSTHFDGLDLVPGSHELNLFEYEYNRHSETLKGSDVRGRMVSAIKEVDGNYDVVVIHCAPKYSDLNLTAIEAATGVLVTVRPQLADIASTGRFLNIFSNLVASREKTGTPVSYDFIKFLVTRHDPRDVSQQETVALLRDSLGDDLLTATVWISDAIQEARRRKRSLYELSAGAVGRSAYEQAMESLNSTNAEVMDIIREVWGRPSQASRSTAAGKAKS